MLLSILLTVGFLVLVIAVVKQLNSKEVQPILTAYFLVIGAGCFGVVSLSAVIPLWANSTGMAVICGALGLAYLGVTLWGLLSFRRFHFGS